MRPGIWWGGGVLAAMASLGAAWWAIGSGAADEAPSTKVKLTAAELASLPVSQEGDRIAELRHLGPAAPGLTADAVDAALDDHREGIVACVEAARVHGVVPEPLSLVLELGPSPRLAVPGLRIESVAAGVSATLDGCLRDALRQVRFDGRERVEIRASWTANP